MDPLRVVLIGPERTGKTWLASALAGHYRAPWSPEYAREYVGRHGRALGYADVEPIGRGQIAVEDAAAATARAEDAALVILDTDLVSTMVYSRHYYRDCPLWIEREACRRLGDLYLLHQVDVDWTPEGVQREQPGRREELFVRFRATLELLEARFYEIEGEWEERRSRAIAAIGGLLATLQGGGR